MITHYVNNDFRSLSLLIKLVILGLNLAFFPLAKAESDTQEINPLAKFMLDQRAWLVGRTYPSGGQAFYTLGSNYLLWGDASNWKYGFIRAAFNGATSLVINRVGVEFQFYPISILGLSAGYDWGFRSIQPKFADCSNYECMGRVDRAFVKGQMLAAYKSVAFMGNFRYEELHHASNDQMFFDEITMLPCNSNEERVVIYNPSLMLTVSDKVKVGATSILAKGLTTDTLSHMYGPAVHYAFHSRANIALGFGQNRSTVVHSALTAFFLFSYTISPSLSVIDLSLRKEGAN